MLPRNHPNRIQITFDDHRLVANVGPFLPATLALHLGLPAPTPPAPSDVLLADNRQMPAEIPHQPAGFFSAPMYVHT